MSDLRDLYQGVIIDHSKNPRNFRKLEEANRTAMGHNPLCGDKLTVYLDVEDGIVKEATFQGAGCAISIASASMMTEAVKGKSLEEAEHMFTQFQEMVTTPLDEILDTEGLGNLGVFSIVRNYPARVKCASLAWHTVHTALGGEEVVSTE